MLEIEQLSCDYGGMNSGLDKKAVSNSYSIPGIVRDQIFIGIETIGKWSWLEY